LAVQFAPANMTPTDATPHHACSCCHAPSGSTVISAGKLRSHTVKSGWHCELLRSSAVRCVPRRSVWKHIV
jgi:hypothetical protein